MIFDLGDSNNPKGHALVYFTVSTEPEKVYSSYIVILPLKSDLSKYVPPFLASTLGDIPSDNFTAFSMPPAPEDNYSLQQLRELANMRSDDLINGGSIFSYDVTRLMELANNTVQEYSSTYSDKEISESDTISIDTQNDLEPAQDTSFDVNTVLFDLMTEKDKLSEVTKLLSKLKFSQDSDDTIMAEETTAELQSISKYLPSNFKISELIRAATNMKPNGLIIASLYLDRCYKIAEEDYESVKKLDEQIDSLDR